MTELDTAQSDALQGFPSLSLRANYDSSDPNQEVVSDFLIPALNRAETYDRLSGFFNSGMIAAAARGMASFISRGKKMRIVASPQLSAEDIEALQGLTDRPQEFSRIEEALRRSVDGIDAIVDEFEKDHVSAFCWMLQSGQLEMRIAVPQSIDGRQPLFHSKVGFMTDALGNSLSFSGSINETSAGWQVNVEQFEVFSSWGAGYDPERCQSHKELFERFWDFPASAGVFTLPLPEALKQDLVKRAPTGRRLPQLPQDYGPKPEEKTSDPMAGLRDYQKEAILEWEKNQRVGLLAMATGTGKTKTAVAALRRTLNEKERVLILISAPQQQIAQQWEAELKDLIPITSWGTPGWRRKTAAAVDEIAVGYRDFATVIFIQNSGAKEASLELWEEAEKNEIPVLYVADEAHGLGAREMRKNLVESFQWRLGLSATPDRYFDDEGKTALEDYFQGTVFDFSTDEALKWVDPKTGATPLSQYRYFPYFYQLEDDELDRYKELTQRAVALGAGRRSFGDGNDPVARLLMERAKVVKKSKGKLEPFRRALAEHGPISQCLVYCQDKEQLAEASAVLKSLGVEPRQFTGEEGSEPEERFAGLSERDWILKDLANGFVDAVVAMKCLDEGVDVPGASLGFILASSGNPREFIQRRGRLLRRAPGKHVATIVDFIATPPIDDLPDGESRGFEMAIFERDIQRTMEIARSALNYLDVAMELDRLREQIG